jgi:chromosome partitioning protein
LEIAMLLQNNLKRPAGSKSLPVTLLSKAILAAVEFSGFGPIRSESTNLPNPIRRSKSSMVIGIASFKGGSGKTTLAVNVAVGFIRSKRETLLIDADSGQGSAARWGWARNRRDLSKSASLPVQLVPEVSLVKTLKTARSLGWQITIVDLPGSRRPGVTEAFKVCDLVFVACRPTAVDVSSAKSTMRALKSLNIAAAYILTQAPSGRERVERFRELLSADGIVLSTHLASRVAYQDSCAFGLGVLESTDALAKLEMQNLMLDINLFSGSRKK